MLHDMQARVHDCSRFIVVGHQGIPELAVPEVFGEELDGNQMLAEMLNLDDVCPVAFRGLETPNVDAAVRAGIDLPHYVCCLIVRKLAHQGMAGVYAGF